MQLQKEIAALKGLVAQSKKKQEHYNYTIEIRAGEIHRTILSTVYNGTDFDRL